ncbi:MAG: polysaccharide deacetylase family protein [Patescibacteria group bacterium]|nr:polysaccharide deacetylase family protein [Patescibacteria group bacterium]
MKKKSRQSDTIRLPIFILTLLLLSLFSFFVLPPLSITLGDQLIVGDQINKAEVFYKIAKTLNPINFGVDKRIQISQALKEERKGESEETMLSLEEENKAIVLGPHNSRAVLGASVTIPVLMYHYIRINPNSADKVGFGLSVTPGNFNAQMDYLAAHGYSPITLDELGAALFYKTKLPSKPIVITFDDGYRDAYVQAFPILRNHGFRAVSFVITGFVGGPGFLTWDQIDEMRRSGIFTFESHTVNHVALTYSTNDGVLREETSSKTELQKHLGYAVNWLAYPYGNVNARVAGITPKAGYVGAFGTNNGIYHSTDMLFTLPRIRVGGGDSVQSFAAKLPW